LRGEGTPGLPLRAMRRCSEREESSGARALAHARLALSDLEREMFSLVLEVIIPSSTFGGNRRTSTPEKATSTREGDLDLGELVLLVDEVCHRARAALRVMDRHSHHPLHLFLHIWLLQLLENVVHHGCPVEAGAVRVELDRDD